MPKQEINDINYVEPKQFIFGYKNTTIYPILLRLFSTLLVFFTGYNIFIQDGLNIIHLYLFICGFIGLFISIISLYDISSIRGYISSVLGSFIALVTFFIIKIAIFIGQDCTGFYCNQDVSNGLFFTLMLFFCIIFTIRAIISKHYTGSSLTFYLVSLFLTCYFLGISGTFMLNEKKITNLESYLGKQGPQTNR